jgi:hypothetical protein
MSSRVTYSQLIKNFSEYKLRMDSGEKFIIDGFDSKPEDYIAHTDKIPDIEFADLQIKGIHTDHNEAS